jgi:hypothetical protein
MIPLAPNVEQIGFFCINEETLVRKRKLRPMAVL